ncbi:MAG: chemotaxis protein CheA [Desulfarculus sp.]|nr:chemotaxis protein CheA [Desulfarculus sp.]
MAQGARQVQAQEVKIDTVKLDNLLDMVGELVIAQSMVAANPKVQAINDRKLAADLSQLARITTELQKSTMAMRMVPIKQTFQKMVRVVRDTAKKQGKAVRLLLEGETTEIDRNMVEKFYEPLVHMVRNSVDHGIESVEERLAAGKPEEGTVTLAAYHKGGNVCIEIRDDGKGLNRQKIVAKAIERGLISGDEGLSDEEAFHLIFEPGFSTAEVITDISGRGVGMDVVKRTMEELRGKIEIRSLEGQGTTFTIALPLTLAIIDGMVVEAAGERFILPTVAVVESLRPRREEYSTVQGRGEMIMIRGNLLPLIRLHEVVNDGHERPEPWDTLVVVVEHHGQRRCLLVDRLIGRQEVVIKSLGESLKDVKVVAGGAIMGDGRVGLILDVEGVFKAHENRRA